MQIFPAQSVCPHCKTVYRYGDLNAIKFKKKRDAFCSEHESELKLFYLVKRKLAAVSPEHKFPVPEWKKELKKLEVSYEKQSEELEPIRQELKELYRIKGKIDYILQQQETQEIQETRKEKHAQEEETH
jgi:predicted nucleotidyltransferase